VLLFVSLDFELAPVNVLKRMFPHASYSYCLFHMCQSLFRNFQKKGLLDLYQVLEIKVLLRSFNSLAFLPINEVSDGYEEIVASVEQKIASGMVPAEKADSLRGNFFMMYVKI